MTADFFQNFEFWRDALLAATLAAILCSFVGVYILLKRIVFVSAAISQMSGVGVAVSFWVASAAATDPHHAPFYLHPLLFAGAFAALGAVLFSLNIGRRRLASETVVGLGYLIAAASVILILSSERITREAHEVTGLLYGNSVTVPPEQLLLMACALLVVALLHVLFGKEFLFVSFDAEMARTLGLPARFWNLLLYLTFAVSISVSTRAIGALPVFAFMVIPPAVGLLVADRLRMAFAISIAVGVLSAAFGYYASYRWSLPTGAAMVITASLFLLPALLRLRMRGNR